MDRDVKLALFLLNRDKVRGCSEDVFEIMCVCFYPKSLVLDVVRCVAYIDTQYCNAHTVLSRAEMLPPQLTAASALH